MATIGKFTGGVNTPSTITETALTGADTFTYDPSGVLVIRNSTGASVTVTLTGSASTGSKLVEGGGTVALSGGVPVVVGAGSVKSIKLGSIRDFLKGTIAVTGGSAGVFAYILK